MGYAHLYIERKTNVTKETRLKTLKEKYNILLRQLKPLEKFLDTPSLPVEIREKRTPEFKDVCRKINFMIAQIYREGLSPTGQEILRGFDV